MDATKAISGQRGNGVYELILPPDQRVGGDKSNKCLLFPAQCPGGAARR